MKSVVKCCSLSLVVYLLFLIIKLPAVQVIANLPLGKEISINGISGTIWQGHADRVQVNGLPITDVNWSLAFLPLLMGKISADINAGNIRDVEQISVTGHLSFAGQEVQGQNILVYVPTNLAISLLPLPIPVQADGRFKVQLSEVDYAAGCQTFSGSGEWLNANFTGTTGIIDLGNFAADLSCENGNIVINVNQPNRFGLTAKAQIPADLKFNVEGRFKPDPDLPKEVHQAAQFFGNTDSNGYYAIKF